MSVETVAFYDMHGSVGLFFNPGHYTGLQNKLQRFKYLGGINKRTLRNKSQQVTILKICQFLAVPAVLNCSKYWALTE
jgi:hypothetical protein